MGCILIWIVSSEEHNTCRVDYYPFEHAFLGRVANRIINEVRGINRVTYDITSKLLGSWWRMVAAGVICLKAEDRPRQRLKLDAMSAG